MSLAVLADHMASKGRGPDSMLIHMSPTEVQGLQALAMKHGGSLTINPETGLPEAGFLDKLLPAIIGFAITATTGIPAWQVGLGVGAVETARTGDLGRGISAGFGAYGGAGLGAGMTAAPIAEAAGSQIASQASGLTGQAALEGIQLPSNYAELAAKTATPDQLAAARSSMSLGDLASKTATSVGNNPSSLLTKDNAKYLMAAAAPVLADQAVKSNLPTTTTRPGEVHRFSYNPYNQYYTPVGNYEVPVKSAAGGGLMGMDNGGYNPGQLNFTGGGDPIVRMASGGSTVRMAKGTPPAMLTDEQLYQASGLTGQAGWEAAAKARDAQNAAMNTYNLTDNATVGANINKWITDNPFATTTDINNAIKSSGLTQELVNPYLTANTNISDAARYALSHASEMPGGGGLAGLNANIMNEFKLNPGMNQTTIDRLQDIYKVSDADIQNPLSHGSQVATADMGKAANYLATNPDVMAWINSAEGKAYVKAHPEFDMNDIAFTHYQRYGAGEGRKWEEAATKTPITCGPGYRLNAAGTACEPIPIIDTGLVPSGYHYENGVLVKNIDATQNTSTDVTTPTNLYTAPSTALPVGISGNTGPSQIGGGATINPNGTITTSPRIPGIPVGGFTGMEQVRDAYTKGGGKLGYTSPTFKSLKEVEDKYKLTGGSKAAYDYLTGKTKYSPKPVTETGEIMTPYAESVLGVPSSKSSKQYLFDPDTRKYKLNPDFIPISYTSEGEKVYGLSSKDIATQLPDVAASDYEKWMKDNYVTHAQVAQALNISLAEAKKRYPLKKSTDTTTADANTSSESSSGTGGEANGGLMATGGLAALTMARGGTTHMPFFSKSTGKFTSRGPQVYAGGGMSDQYDLGGYSDGGRLLRGPGDGVSDSIPATIGNKRPARLADGEFVVPARIVSELGNGSTEAGARKLYAMMDRVQSARKGSIGKGKVANNSRADKYLPA